jgi:hypothetical protein
VSEKDLAPIEIKTRLAENGKTLSVFLLPWDVGKECSARTELLWSQLNALRDLSETSSTSAAQGN